VTVTAETLRTSGEDPVARALLAAVEAEFGVPPDPGGAALVTPAELSPPRGFYVALLEGGEAVAGGGVRGLGDGDGAGEVKRMYVAPPRRGEGLGRRLLGELEATARDAGFARLRLDTFGGLAAFYESAGYVPIDDYNGNPYATFWGEKAL
jgi:GNAT superfamily N-acetyltransferase